MVDLLNSLEPRREYANVILFNELDDFTEIMFFNKGIIELGYELNRNKTFILRQKESIVGDHGCLFNHKCSYIYRTYTTCEGYFIRKLAMKNILDRYPEISEQLKRKVAVSYFWGIKLKFLTIKNKHIKKLK